MEWEFHVRKPNRAGILGAIDLTWDVVFLNFRCALTNVFMDSGRVVLEMAETHLSDAIFNASMSASLLASKNSSIAAKTAGVFANSAYAFTVRTTAEGTVNFNRRPSSELDGNLRREGLLGNTDQCHDSQCGELTVFR